jgi:hypothetical protein
MHWCRCGKGSLSVVCILILASCAKHRVTPLLVHPLPSPPTMGVPVESALSLAALFESTAEQPENNVNLGEGGVPETIRLLLVEPPRMSLSGGPHVPKPRAPKKGVSKIDPIVFLVDLRDGTLHADSAVTFQNALQAVASQLLFLCPDRMLTGSAEDCRLTTRRSLNDLFRDELLEQGVPALQAAAVPILVHADLTSPSRNAFDIRAVAANSPSSGEHLWRVVPRHPGDHKLELKVRLSARIASAGDLQVMPVVLVHSVSVIGGGTFLNEYRWVMIGCLAAVALFCARALWRSTRTSAFSNR